MTRRSDLSVVLSFRRFVVGGVVLSISRKSSSSSYHCRQCKTHRHLYKRQQRRSDVPPRRSLNLVHLLSCSAAPKHPAHLKRGGRRGCGDKIVFSTAVRDSGPEVPAPIGRLHLGGPARGELNLPFSSSRVSHNTFLQSLTSKPTSKVASLQFIAVH